MALQIWFSIYCEICSKLISESTNRYVICGKTGIRCYIPLLKDDYLCACKSCVRKLEKHQTIKENLEKSAKEIKSLLRTSQKRGVNIVDEGSSVCFIHCYTNQVFW